MKKNIIVDKNGNGDFHSLTDALNSVTEGEAVEILIKNGVYKEKIIIDKPNITLLGEDRDKTILTYDDGAFKPDETGNPMGTFKTASIKVTSNAENFSAQNIHFENNAGMGDIVGQAVALYLDCDKATIKDCKLTSRQDTLLTSPMHEDIGRDPYILNRQYFENCYIEGDVDFIFGGAVAVFKDCEIFSLNRNQEINGYLTAACTSVKRKYGYVFFNCRLKGNASKGTVYLGRPWREYAKTVFIDCTMDEHINEKGFCRWNDTDRHKTCYYAQYNSSGAGFNPNTLAEWTHLLSEEERKEYTIEDIFEGWMK